ncbi:MAG: DUF1592 domain-containing protein [Pirellulaceae bacterium]
MLDFLRPGSLAALRFAATRGILCLVLLYGWRDAGGADGELLEGRVQKGLLALYDFDSSDGSIVKDRADGEQALDLRIADPKAVRHSADGLTIGGKTLIQSEQPASRLIRSIKQSGAIAIEAWVRPARLDQSGPARIVTLSRDANERNFTLGQEGDKFEVRLRTTKTSGNGIPSLASKPKSLRADWMHVVYTYNRAGRARLYLDGKLNAEQQIGGDLSNWNGELKLALANELSGDRPWLGAYRLVAVYDRDLSPAEVERNFRAGRDLAPPTAAELLARKSAANARLFETRIAPLVSQHCLECHDSVTRQGKLDLSHKSAALAGGEQGPAIVAGNPAESRLWQLVESDEMPHDRPPLSQVEKEQLKQWLEGGANWSLEAIDPAIYAHGGGPTKVFVQRLTVPEYIETVRGSVGVDIAKEARELLPRDLRADGFSNTAYNLNVDLGHVEAYANLAEIIVGRMDVKAVARKHTKSRELTDENVTQVIEPLGRRLLRGPLDKEEVTRYCGISTSVAAAGGNFEEAIRYILEAMLQSPRFLYRIESQRGDGSAGPLTPYELASRLSYLLWGGPPDDALLAAAEKQAFNRAEVEAQVRRMLEDPRAVARSRQFITEWLNLDRLENLRPSAERFPDWDARLAADMRHETLAFFEEIVWKQNRPLTDLLNAQITFVTPRLAKHYGLPLDNLPKGDEPVRYDLSSVPGRGGLLTQGSVLTVGGDDASTVTRGLFVMHELLRGVVRDPPPCVDTTPVPTKPGLTQRAIAESRIANQSCAGCHVKFEPLAFGLEKFDGLGSYHDTDEHGNKLRDDGNILFPGEETPVAFESSAELMELLAKSDRVRESFTWKVAQFAVGRPLGAEDAAVVADIHRDAQKAGGTYAGLMTAIVLSDLVQKARTEATASSSLDNTSSKDQSADQ